MFGETAESLQALWVGKDMALIVASDDTRTTVWRGYVVGHGVFRFDKDDSAIAEPVYPLSMRVSTVDPKTVTIVSLSKQYLYVSSEAGHSWGKLPTASFTPESDIFLSHRTPSTLVLGESCTPLATLATLGPKLSFAFGPTHPSLEYLYYSIGAPQSN